MLCEDFSFAGVFLSFAALVQLEPRQWKLTPNNKFYVEVKGFGWIVKGSSFVCVGSEGLLNLWLCCTRGHTSPTVMFFFKLLVLNVFTPQCISFLTTDLHCQLSNNEKHV